MNLSKRLLTFLFAALLTVCSFGQTVTPLSHVRTNDANGVSQDTGKTVTVQGIITVGNEFNSPSYLQDSTGGLAVYGRGTTAFSGQMKAGYLVQVTGKIVNYNGLTEMNPVSSFTKIDSNKTVTPLQVTIPQVVGQAWNGYEQYEGRLIVIKNVTLLNPVATWAANTNYTIKNGTDTLSIRVTTGTSLVGQTAPTGTFDIVGVLSQYKVGAPYSTGYQLMPRVAADIITGGTTATITVTAPNGGENLTVGASQNITWTSTGTIANVKIDYTTDNGSTWAAVAATTTNNGTYAWTVPNTPATQCKVKVSDASNATVFGTSSAVFTIATASGVLNISHLRTNDANGVSQDTGKVVTIKGIVTVGNEFNSPSYIQDATGGVAVYGRGTTAFSGMMKAGYLVQLTGKVVNYNGLTEINPVNTFTKLDSNQTVTPAVVTIPQVVGQTWNGLEQYEGSLIQIKNVTLLNPVATWAANTNYTLKNGTDTLSVRITTGTSLVGLTAPTGTFDIVGVLSQYKVGAPYSTGYQLLPRVSGDITTGGTTASITVTAPNGGENLTVAATQNITWTSTGTIANVKIDYTTDNGTSWAAVVASATNNGTYAWTVPNTPSTQCKVKVSDASNSSVFDASNAVFTIATASGVLNISHVRTNDANGVSQDTGKVVTVKGIITVGNEFNSPSYMQDATGGLAVYGRGTTAFSGQMKAGYLVQVTGKIVNYNGLTEMNPVSSFTKLDSNQTVTPAVVTIPQVVGQAWNGLEQYEGSLIKIKNVTLLNPVATWAANTNYTLKNGNDTLSVRITTGTTLVGQTAPSAAFDIVGVLSQYKVGAPYSSGYQLMPRVAGDVTPASSVKEEKLKDLNYSLEQNYPNPFNPTTQITYQVLYAGKVSLKVYDVLGHEVKTLVNNSQSTGRYTVEFNAAGLPSGMYIYVLRTEGYTAAKKLTLLK
ncbi:MAG: T9SS type A sorting domain-containing protein [Ignavibacteria bacterium]|nr:T9SS type A sorting domain-containing protein [Ignavibacteria bacterium]